MNFKAGLSKRLTQPYFLHPAFASSDYAIISSVLIFISGSTDNATRCVDISILEDNALEGNQTFTVVVATSDPDVMFQTSMTSVTITDNDG